MKVYRSNIIIASTNVGFPVIYANGAWFTQDHKALAAFQPVLGNILQTLDTFVQVGNVEPSKYYKFDGVGEDGKSAKWTEVDAETARVSGRIEIYNIMDGTYTGTDMGERSISAQIEFATPIDFRMGDYVEFDIANLIRGIGVEGGHNLERFYIYTMPTIKKNASKFSSGKAFEHTVTFYPCQYELAATQMRDVLQEQSSGVIYTGYDEFSFMGGAHTLMKRIKAVLDERFGTQGVAGKDHWSYMIADEVNEDLNKSLEQFQFNFSGESVMDAILKLNDKNGINTKFFINERMIYVGYKRPYVCGVDQNNVIRSIPFNFKYGKTSHLPIETNYGNLFSLTKSVGSSSPITRLYAYGADRNLHRFYCADRIKSGRYVSKLMLPSFSDDGRTDYIDSAEGIAKFGIREGSQTFDEVYPSLRYFTYGDVRKVKYCFKLMGSGLESDDEGTYDSSLTYRYPVARVQCFRVEPLINANNEKEMINHLVPCAPPKDVAVFCHATGKVVKCIIYGGATNEEALAKQIAANGVWPNGHGRVPARTFQGTDYIPGSCFAVHDARPTESDRHYGCSHSHGKYRNGKYDETGSPLTYDDWFINRDEIDTSSSLEDPTEQTAEVKAKLRYQNEIEIHQINYTDTHWITDVFYFESYDQENFVRDGLSAYCWPRVNSHFYESDGDSLPINEVVAVGPVLTEDTDLNSSSNGEGKQSTFDIYLRDPGFKVNEQTWFGDYVFLFDHCTVNFLDGNLGGMSFDMLDESDNKIGENIVCALKDDGTINPDFIDFSDDPELGRNAMYNGAFWKIRCRRNETDITNYWLPNINVNANAGDHIVFLDIFMPDIYIRVAEQRLLKEAKKYLDANDDGDIQYSFEMDKVRMLKTPLFGLQMREGAIMRIKDDDLAVATVNEEQYLFHNDAGDVSYEPLQKEDYEFAYVDQSYGSWNNKIPLQWKKYKSDGVLTKVDKIGDSWAVKFRVDNQDVFNEDSWAHLDPDGNLVVYVTKEQLRIWENESGQISYFSGDKPTDYTQCDIWRTGEKIIRIKYQENFTYYKPVYVPFVYSDGGYIKWEECHASKNVTVDPVVKYVQWDSEKQAYRVTCKMCDELKPTDIRGLYVGRGGTQFRTDSSGQHITEEWAVYYDTAETAYTRPVYQVLPFMKVPKTKNLVGQYIVCKSNDMFSFKPNKTYEVVVDICNRTEWWPEQQIFCLVNGLGDGTNYYFPDYTKEVISGESYSLNNKEGNMRVKFTFQLPDAFNDNKDYYAAIQYYYNRGRGANYAKQISIALVSILERNTDEYGEIADYVDLSINNITVKFHDNTREHGTALQDGNEPTRRASNDVSAMSREITATVKEECRATGWASVMNKLADTAKLAEQNIKTYESLVTAARRNYQNILALKNNIFDPDGNCNETFLQVMMLQVGADSMNYQLMYTHRGVTGILSNCAINTKVFFDTASEKYVDAFEVAEQDQLDHYVFTADEPSGRWYVNGNFYKNLTPDVAEDGTITWPTYFVAIKTPIHNSQGAEWVCDTQQHLLNELDGYYYFNWGILTADSEGRYTLMETRGNAYMYGDNVVCGKISTLAGNSWFDLTHGNFQLSQSGDDTTPALSYIDGVLTISGYASEDDLDDILERLGLIEDIGGENLTPIAQNYTDTKSFNLRSNTYEYAINIGRLTGTNPDTYADFDAGKYVMSFKRYFAGCLRNDAILVSTNTIKLSKVASGYTDNDIIVSYSGNLAITDKKFSFELASSTQLYLIFSAVPRTIINPISGDNTDRRFNKMQVVLADFMLQKGSFHTNYQEYIQHLTNALQGSTQIAGGLVMTNLLMLKNEDGDVVAGMSGRTDSYSGSTDSTHQHSEGVTLWGGGSYADALLQAQGLLTDLQQILPVLLTKTGIGSRIGPLVVMSNKRVRLEKIGNDAGDYIDIDADEGIAMYADNTKVLSITPKPISLNKGYYQVSSAYSNDMIPATTIPTAGNTSVVTFGYFLSPITEAGTYILNTIRFTIKGQTGLSYTSVILPYKICIRDGNNDRHELISGVGQSAGAGSGSMFFVFGLDAQNKSAEVTLPTGQVYLEIMLDARSVGLVIAGNTIQIQCDNVFNPAGIYLCKKDNTKEVKIGSNGMIIDSGNSCYLSASTQENNKIKLLAKGIPNYLEQNIESGEFYIGTGSALYYKP